VKFQDFERLLSATSGHDSTVQALRFVSVGWISKANMIATAARHQTMTAPAGMSKRVDRTSPDT
jgi:hypothetical protein